MNLMSKVVFKYCIDSKFLNNYGSFSKIRELRQALKDTEQPYKLTVTRSVQIIDKHKKEISCTGNEKYKTFEIDKNVLTLFIYDDLVYPCDIREILIKKYGSVLDFDNRKWDENKPVCDFNVVYDTKSTTDKTTLISRYSVCGRHVRKNDIIVDTNLKQIWPIRTNKAPIALKEFLARKKVKIKQG